MKGGHKRWEQHRPQDHHEYHGWKEHHITYFSSAKRIGASAFSKAHATLRSSRPVKGESSGDNHVTRSVLFGEGRPDDRRLGAVPEIRGGRHRCIGDTKAFRSITTTV
jgi:hypothetical protein